MVLSEFCPSDTSHKNITSFTCSVGRPGNPPLPRLQEEKNLDLQGLDWLLKGIKVKKQQIWGQEGGIPGYWWKERVFRKKIGCQNL